MEKRIYKYVIETTDKQVINLPVDAEILSVQVQREWLCLWALINPFEKENEERHIEIFRTGHSIHYDMGVERKFITTYQLEQGSFIGHVFERIN